MKRLIYCLAFGFLAMAAFAQTSRPAPKTALPPIPDLVNGPIDPYDFGREKLRFFGAAGADNELSKEEAEKNKTADKPFIRSFDTFSAMLVFDKDKNGKINWLEADAYRKDQRNKILAKFDVDKDKKLRGPERNAANQFLAAGGLSTKVVQRRGWTPSAKEQLRNNPDVIKEYDTDGDGKVSDKELEEAMNKMRKKHHEDMLARYDADGDGKLSEDERKAMQKDQQGEWKKWQNEFRLKHFDEDGDGKLSKEELAEAKAFDKQLGETLQKTLKPYFEPKDLDGDGKISQDERTKSQGRLLSYGLVTARLYRKWGDSDGDGKLSSEEQNSFRKKTARSMKQWFFDYSVEFDQDQNGKLSKDERSLFITGLQKDISRRLEIHDKDSNGQLTVEEFEKFFREINKDMNIAPADKENNQKPTNQDDHRRQQSKNTEQ